jgi:tripartite-type tricarboxylate transporter receptor subunit TctC
MRRRAASGLNERDRRGTIARTVALWFASCLLVSSPAGAAVDPAATYPSKPVRIVVSASPGAITDTQARLFSQKLSEHFGQQFVTDNRPGAAGLIGFQTVAKATPDGYTLIAASPSLSTVYAFQEKPAYDPVHDFAPISLIFRAPYLIVVHPSVPATSMTSFIEFASSRPGTLTFGLGGAGSIQHLAAAWIISATRVKMVLVSYKGIAPALVDLMGGQIQATMANIANVGPLVRSGKLRALALTGLERSSALPDVKTVAESGIAGFDVTSWQGWLAPRGTPTAILNRLSVALADAVRLPAISEKLTLDGAMPVGSTPAEFKNEITAQAKRFRRLVDEGGLRAVQ